MMRFTPLSTENKRKKSLKMLLHPVAAAFFWILLWQLAALAVRSELILPSPIVTIKTLAQLMTTSDFPIKLGMTLLRVFGGIFLSCFIAFVLGIICGLYAPIQIFFKPFASVTRTLPVVSVIILINLWISSNWVPLIVTFLMCFPIMWMNTVTGIRETDPAYLEMARTFGVSHKRILVGIYLPSVSPYVKAAVINAVGMSWKATVTAEVLANARPSVGMSLYYAKTQLETPTLFAWTLLLIIISLVIEKITNRLFGEKESV